MNYKWTNENTLLFRKLTLLYLKIVCSEIQLNQKILAAGNVILTRVLYYVAMIMYILLIIFYYNNTLQ